MGASATSDEYSYGRSAPVAGLLLACGDDAALLWELVADRPLLAWTVAAFEQVDAVHETILLLRPDDMPRAAALAQADGWRRTRLLATDAPRRRDAALAGLLALDARVRTALAHDAARPLVTPRIIEDGLAAYARRGGAVTAVEPVKETIKRVRGGVIVETVPRERLVRAQTPFIASREGLLALYRSADPTLDAPDDVSLALALGVSVGGYPGSHENIRVAAADDLSVAAALLRRRMA